MIPQLTTKEAKAWAETFEKRFNMKPSPSAGGLSYDGVNLRQDPEAGPGTIRQAGQGDHSQE